MTSQQPDTNSNESNSHLLYIVVVYDDEELCRKLYNESFKKPDNPRVGFLFSHQVNLDCCTEQKVLKDESSTLCVRILEHLKIKEPSQTEPLPIIFIGLGLGALVTMQFVLSYEKWIPMGAVLTSVSRNSSTWGHPHFPGWYGKLKEREDEAFRAFKYLLISFNDRCRQDRIRFSCVSLEGEESKQVSRIKAS
jgi:hypothetical protein